MKLLYAEDEPAMSEAVVDILTYHNYMIDAVQDGQDALDYALAQPYDALILDIMMPKLSGLEVLQKLRAAGCQAFSHEPAAGQGSRPAPPAGRLYPYGAPVRQSQFRPESLHPI